MSLSALFVCGGRSIVCSDSRRSNRLGESRDDLKKLFQAGRFTSLSIAGVSDLGPGEHVPNRIEKLLADANLADHPQKLLSAIADDLFEPAARWFERNPGGFDFASREVFFTGSLSSSELLGPN